MYSAYQLNRTLAAPVNWWAELVRRAWSHPRFPLSGTKLGRAVAGAGEVLERVTRRYPKKPFDLATTRVDGDEVAVREVTVLDTPFCKLVRFERDTARQDPKLLVVAPLSGNHASMLRETVEQLLPEHDVYVTDWVDARLVPITAGRFDLDDYVALLERFIRHLGPDLHVLAVSQPCVPLLAAVALLEEANDAAVPASMTLMAGPIDTRVGRTKVDWCAVLQPLAWYRLTAVERVPFGAPGFLRRVHPGFMQLTGFVAVDLPRHVGAHRKLYRDLVAGAEEGADAYRRFYDDYLSVMDVPAEYYLDTVRRVFHRRELARGVMSCGGRRVRPELIRRTALMTVEGSRDVICGPGQTAVAHTLCSGIPAERREHLTAEDAGHFGVFRGRRWREEIAPRVRAFIRRSAQSAPALPDAANSPAAAIPPGIAAMTLVGS